MDFELLLNCYETRSINTVDWFTILDNIILDTEYHIYRKSYLGENAGCTKVSTIKTNTMTLIGVISGIKDADNTKKTKVKLLLENNQLKIINKIIPASWSNNKYLLNNTENTIM